MLILRREAEADVRAAYEWYERQREGLGRIFLAEIDRLMASVEEQPEIYSELYRSVRRALCRRFPDAIYFVRRNPNIVILGVLHQRRHPWLRQRRVTFPPSFQR